MTPFPDNSNQKCSAAAPVSASACASVDFCRIKLKTASGSLTIRFRMPPCNSNNEHHIAAESSGQAAADLLVRQLVVNQAEHQDQNIIAAATACCSHSCFDYKYTLSNILHLQTGHSDHHHHHRSDPYCNRNCSNRMADQYQDPTFEMLEDLAEATCRLDDSVIALNGIGATTVCFEYAHLQPDFSPYYFWINDSRCSESVSLSIVRDSSKEFCDNVATDIPDGSSLFSNIVKRYDDIQRQAVAAATANPVPTVSQGSCNCARKLPCISTDGMENSSLTEDVIETEDPSQKYYGSRSSESAATTAESGPDDDNNNNNGSDSELIQLASEMLHLQLPISISDVLLCSSSSSSDGDNKAKDNLMTSVEAASPNNISTRSSGLLNLGRGVRILDVEENEQYLRTTFPRWPRDRGCKGKRQRRLRRGATPSKQLAISLGKLIPARWWKTETSGVRGPSDPSFDSRSCDISPSRILAVSALPVIVSSSNTSSSTPKKNKNKNKIEKRRTLPSVAVEILERWLHSHIVFPFATKEDKMELALTTGLTLSQVENWLSNARYKLKRVDETYKSRVDQVRRSLQLHRSQQKRGAKRKYVISSV